MVTQVLVTLQLRREKLEICKGLAQGHTGNVRWRWGGLQVLTPCSWYLCSMEGIAPRTRLMYGQGADAFLLVCGPGADF